MSHFEITGGVPLHGEVCCSGAKNAALPIMAAAILASEPVRLENVPRLADVRTQARLLRLPRFAGRTGSAQQEDRHSCLSPACLPCPSTTDRNVCPPDRTSARRRDLLRRMRAGFCVLGPLLARRGRAVVPLPGGCNIGNRPVDLHLKGLAALGADIRLEHGYVVASARRLHGATIDLSGPQRLHRNRNGQRAERRRAGPRRNGHSRRGAWSRKSSIWAIFSSSWGAKIEGQGTGTIRIEGVDQLGGATHRLIPDRDRGGHALIAAAITGGSATVTGVVPEHLAAVLQKLDAAGAAIETVTDCVSISAPQDRLRAVDIIAQPYPGFPTDVQAQWTALNARWPRALPGGRPRVSRPIPARRRTKPPGGQDRMCRRRGDRQGRGSTERRTGRRPTTSGPAPPWCWPPWRPTAAPSSTASTTSTAATSAWTSSCGSLVPASTACYTCTGRAEGIPQSS